MIELLYQALASPHGVVVSTSDADRVRQRLYKLIRESADLSLRDLAILSSPTNPSDLWLVRKQTDATLPVSQDR